MKDVHYTFTEDFPVVRYLTTEENTKWLLILNPAGIDEFRVGNLKDHTFCLNDYIGNRDLLGMVYPEIIRILDFVESSYKSGIFAERGAWYYFISNNHNIY